tara:strand:+ start:21843 stop:22406 length:564 start_codon:yes stop_codon:yes gene_type:complete
MQIKTTALKGVVVITPTRFGDDRGFFSETWNKRILIEHGLNFPDFVQDNHSYSSRSGTVRGLHYQSPPNAQCKLVRCSRGSIFDVAVDVRAGSASYGDWYGRELSFANGEQLWIPAGFLHGFMTLEPDSEIVYKCTDYYSPESDGAVRWDSCGIDWPVNCALDSISKKDSGALPFSDFKTPFTGEEY